MSKVKTMNKMANGQEKAVQVHVVENTPFSIIETTTGEEKTFFATMGKYKLTENKQSFEEAEKEVTEINWNNITRLIMLIVEDNTGKGWKPKE